MADHEAALRRSGKLKAEPSPTLPESLSDVWLAFCDLDLGRGSNGFGLNPLSWADIAAYVALNRTPLRPWHIELIRRLDLACLAAASERAKPVKG